MDLAGSAVWFSVPSWNTAARTSKSSPSTTSGPIETNVHLLKYDSVHGRLGMDVTVDGDMVSVGGQIFKVTAIRDPKELPHKELKVDIALECTGIFTARDKASAHLAAGAKRVLISAPGDGADKTIVMGVNDKTLTKDDLVVSNGSCTTNCLAPVAQVLHDAARHRDAAT